MEEIDIKDLIDIFWNKKISIIVIVIIFIIIGSVYTYAFVVPKYTSSTTLVLTKVSDETTQTDKKDSITTSDMLLNSQLVSTYSELVKSKKVLRTVISNLTSNIKEGELRNSIAVNAVKDTELIEISVTNLDPAVAAQIANEIAKVFTQNVSEIYNINNVHIVDQAETPNSPSNINHIKDLIIFAFLGSVVAVVYVLILNMFDTTVKSTEDIEKMLKLPVLVSIPFYEFEKEDKERDKRISNI